MEETTRGAVNSAESTPKKIYRPNINTLEYGIISNLVVQQYGANGDVNWNALLSIPLTERIPGLIHSYGKKTMHKLLVMILKEFTAALPLTKIKKMTDTRIAIAACEIMLTAWEDQLSLEDLILFLQKAKGGHYGAIKNMSHPVQLLNLMEGYRQARHETYQQMKDAQHAAHKALGDEERTAQNPTSLNDLLHQSFTIDISNRA
jgi:hypothetical protein